jgi:serine/threonine protein kinase
VRQTRTNQSAKHAPRASPFNPPPRPKIHNKKLVHRDIKPANVFVRKDTNDGTMPLVKLGDFGVMKWGDFHASLSTGVLTATSHKSLGTLKYMAPEAAIRPRDVSTRSDMYSLGITLFELFTGQTLASPHHVFEVMNARLSRGTTQSRYNDMGYRVGIDESTSRRWSSTCICAASAVDRRSTQFEAG